MSTKADHVRSTHESSTPDRSSARSSTAATPDVDWSLIDPAQVTGELRAQAMLHLQQTIGNQRVGQSAADLAAPVQRQDEGSWLDYLHTDLPDLGGVGQAWDTISGGLGGAREAWRGGVRGALGSGLEAARGAGSALWGGAQGAVESAMGGLGSAGSAAWGGVEGAAGAIGGGIDQALSGDVLGGLVSGVGGTAESLWGGATGAYGALTSGAGSAADAWLGGVRGAVNSGVQGVQNAGSALWGGATGAAGAIGGAATGLWNQAVDSVPSFNWEDLIM